jgi:hypothetical protein
MSTDDGPANKGRHESDAPRDDYPGDWWPAADEDDAYLVHRNGARLIIRRTAPPQMPTIQTPSHDHGEHYSLEFQPSGSERLVPVVETGSKRGQRYEAERFAALAPDGEPDVEQLAAWVTEEQL